MVRKILKLDQHARERCARSGNKFIDEFIISSTAKPFLPQSDIIWVVQQCFVIRADIQHHRQTKFGVDPRARGVQRKLADGNSHSVSTKVAETQDAFAVCDYDEFRLIRPVCQKLWNAPPIVGADKPAARSLENMTESLASESHGGRIDQRLYLVDVVTHNAKEQRFVAVMQCIKRHIFSKSVRHLP